MASYSIQLSVSGNIALQSYRTIQLAALGTITPNIPSGAGGVIIQQFDAVSPRGYEEIQMFLRQPYGYVEIQGSALGWCGGRDLLGIVQIGAYGAVHDATYPQEVLTQMEVIGSVSYPPIFPRISTTTSGNLYQDFIRWDDRYDSIISGYKVISRDFTPVATGFDSITAPANIFVDPRTNSTENTYALTLPATPTTAYTYRAGDIISVQLPICPFTAGTVSINVSGFHFSGIYPPYSSSWTSVAATDSVSSFFDTTRDIYFSESQVGKPYILNMQMSAVENGSAITYEINGPSGHLGIGNPIIYAGSGTVTVDTPATLTETVISNDNPYTKRIIVPDEGDDTTFYALSTTSGYLTFPHQVVSGLTEFTVDAWWWIGSNRTQVLWGTNSDYGIGVGVISGVPAMTYLNSNLQANGDFETGDLTGWTRYYSADSGTVTVMAGSGYLGTSGCVIQNNAPSYYYQGLRSNNIDVTKGDIITISCIRSGIIALFSFDGTNLDGATYRVSQTSLGGNWYRDVVRFPAPRTKANATMIIAQYSKSGIMILDDISITNNGRAIGEWGITSFVSGWMHQTVTWKSGQYIKDQIYSKGTLHTIQTTDVDTISYYCPDTTYIMGASGITNGPSKLASFRIWGRALSDDEISAVRFNPFMYDNTTLVCYRFDSADGQYVYDLTGNDNNAYLGSGITSDIWDPTYIGPYVFFTPTGPQ